MSYIGSNEDDGETTSPFEHVTYVSFERVDPSEVTATVERDALSGDVDPDALRPTSSGIVAAERVEPTDSETELDTDDLVIEMASLGTGAPSSRPPSSGPRTTRSSAPPPLPSRASRASLPATVRTPSLPPTLRAPEPPPAPPVPAVASLEPTPLSPVVQGAIPLPPPVFSAPSGPQLVPPPPPSAAQLAPVSAAFATPPRVPHAPFPPAFQTPPNGTGGAFGFSEAPSVAPVAMSLSFGTGALGTGSGPFDAYGRRRGVRLSRAAIAGLVVLLGASAAAFVAVASGRLSRGARGEVAASSPASEMPVTARETPAPAVAETTSPASEPVASSPVPTLQPAALPSVSSAPSVAVESLPRVEVDPAMTSILTGPAAKGHRVFVDGRAIGHAGTALKTKCGEHKVKVGSAGKEKVLDLPCGGERTVD